MFLKIYQGSFLKSLLKTLALHRRGFTLSLSAQISWGGEMLLIYVYILPIYETFIASIQLNQKILICSLYIFNCTLFIDIYPTGFT
jgi:hypothetical protein